MEAMNTFGTSTEQNQLTTAQLMDKIQDLLCKRDATFNDKISKVRNLLKEYSKTESQNQK